VPRRGRRGKKKKGKEVKREKGKGWMRRSAAFIKR
jgi:hypothetical protein